MHYALVRAKLRRFVSVRKPAKITFTGGEGVHWTTLRSRSAARTIPRGRFAAG